MTDSWTLWETELAESRTVPLPLWATILMVAPSTILLLAVGVTIGWLW
jgi:hypothetical protein